MEYIFTPGMIGLVIRSTPSMAKSIAIIRKYNPVAMSEIKKAIESGDYVLTCEYSDESGVRKIRRCYDQLTKAGMSVEIYEHERLTSREILTNLIQSHRQTEREVRAQVEAEAAAEE